MIVTGVKIRPCKTTEESLKAVASIFLDKEYVVNGIQLRQLPNGCIRLSFPYIQESVSGIRPFAFTPLTAAARERIERQVLRAYESYLLTEH